MRKKHVVELMKFLGRAFLFVLVVGFVMYMIVPSREDLNKGGIPSAYGTIQTRWQMAVETVQNFQKNAGLNMVEVVEEPPEAPLSAEELVIKAELEKNLTKREPTCRLTRKDSAPIDGYLLEEYPTYIVFGQKYGDSAEFKMRVSRDQIDILEMIALPDLPAITTRDVRFHQEFPNLFFFKAEPYTVISQESYFSVQRMIQEQQRLYNEFTTWFGPVIGSATNSTDIQLLVFSDRALFAEYMAVHAPEFEGFSGLYTHRENRLITYHQRDSQWAEDGVKKIDAVAKEYQGKNLDSQNAARLRTWQITEKNRLNGVAQQATDRTLRHEGAHQLFFSLGVQSSRQQGRLWVTEGLATFCESEKIGRLNLERIRSLKEAVDANSLISFAELLSMTKMPDAQKYAETWSLVHMLMQPQYKAQFFDYLLWLRGKSSQPAKDPAGELTGFLCMDSTQLAERWEVYVSELIRQATN